MVRTFLLCKEDWSDAAFVGCIHELQPIRLLQILK